MLAEQRSKQKWSVNPNGSEWSNDTTKFGSKMLEKMGWTRGKGLGANEDGRTEHVKVKKKADLRGIGFSSKNAHNWVDHQDDFTSLLANLNDHHGENADTTSEVASLEERSKTQKRVHYHKFARGKDLSNYRQNDLDAIFGVRPSKSAPATPVDSSDSDSSGGDSTSSCPVVDKRLAESRSKKTKKVQSNQVTSTMSVQEYFAQRMASIKNKQKAENKTVENRGRIEEISSTTKDAEESDISSNPDCKQKKRKKKTETKSTAKDVVSSTNDIVSNSEELIEDDKHCIENDNHSSAKRKKKSKKKKKDVGDNEPLTDSMMSGSAKANEPDSNLVDSSCDVPIKKKKKGKKRTRQDEDDFDSNCKSSRTD